MNQDHGIEPLINRGLKRKSSTVLGARYNKNRDLGSGTISDPADSDSSHCLALTDASVADRTKYCMLLVQP